MSPRSKRRLSPLEIKADRDALVAVKELRTYTAVNPAYSIQAASELEAAMLRAQEEEAHVVEAVKDARAASFTAEWALHNAILGIKRQVIAQYDPDADIVHVFRLKKKSERKRRVRQKEDTKG
jgi:hypothetical protein